MSFTKDLNDYTAHAAEEHKKHGDSEEHSTPEAC
jgi:hypothetical protein